MQISSGDQIQEKEADHGDNDAPVEGDRDRAADDVPLRNSAATVMSNHQQSPTNVNIRNKNSPPFIRNFGSFDREQPFGAEKGPANDRVPTATFHGGNSSSKADRRFAVSVPPRLKVADVRDLYSPYEFEREIELRMSQKKLKR